MHSLIFFGFVCVVDVLRVVLDVHHFTLQGNGDYLYNRISA